VANIKNKSVYSDDKEYLQRLADELNWLGRGRWVDLNLKEGRLTQLVYPPRRQPKKKEEKEKVVRNKRAESAARHS
jgi:hypothetical protein